MKNCKDCSKNDWSFKAEAGMTVATCKNCNNQLRWATKKSKRPTDKNQPHACSCGSKKFKRAKEETTIEALRMPHYFTYFYVCEKCGAKVPDPTTKKINLLYKE